MDVVRAKRAKAEGQTAGAESSRRVLGILMSFHHDRPTATVEALAAEIGVPKSTAYRYVMLLREVGLLELGSAGVQVSPRAIELARAAIAANGIVQVARPTIVYLRDRTGESARLTRRLGESAVCIDQAESGHPVRLSYELGQLKPLHGGASAKVLLASMPSREQEAYLKRLPKILPDKARRTALLEELPLIRQRGWAVSEGEVDVGVWAAAAAVSNGRDVVAAVSVSAPAYRLAKKARTEILAMVQKGAREISLRLTPMHE